MFNLFLDEYGLIVKDILSQLSSEYILKSYKHWNENNIIFFEMEYCFDNLRDVLMIKPKLFQRSANQAMNSIEYYISCEIFRQITEALNCLHTFEPKPLIHRNLKPKNILIGKSGYKRVCKLADFGLVVSGENEFNDQQIIVEKEKYSPEEIKNWRDCDKLSDIFSLGKVCLDIFDLGDSK